MAMEVCIHCEGKCTETCFPVPMPFDYLVACIGDTNEAVTKKALKILHGHSFLFYCQKKEKLFEMPLGG